MIPSPYRAPWLCQTARVFTQAGEQLYAVGGVVRNALMNLPASDVDVCGSARPDAVLRLCENTSVHAVLRAAHFGTVELHASDATGRHMAEYTTFRVDSYRCGHKPSAIRFADRPEADALRRDFSVNALYRALHADPDEPAEVIDPTGGLAHLRQRVLHTVTDNPDAVLKDDGLRILRAARFQAELGLMPTQALLSSATRYAPLLRDIAMERLKDELTKLLLADTRYPTLPRDVPPVTAGLNTLLTVQAWQPLFGALLPNPQAIAALGSYRTPDGMPPVAGKLALLFIREQPQALAQRMQALRFSVRETEAASTALTATHALWVGKLSLVDALRLGRPAITHAVDAFAALTQAGEPYQAQSAQAQELLAAMQSGIPMSLRALAVSGDDLLPLCQSLALPAKVIGATLDALWRATVAGVLPNERQALLAQAVQLLQGHRAEG